MTPEPTAAAMRAANQARLMALGDYTDREIAADIDDETGLPELIGTGQRLLDYLTLTWPEYTAKYPIRPVREWPCLIEDLRAALAIAKEGRKP